MLKKIVFALVLVLSVTSIAFAAYEPTTLGEFSSFVKIKGEAPESENGDGYMVVTSRSGVLVVTEAMNFVDGWNWKTKKSIHAFPGEIVSFPKDMEMTLWFKTPQR